MTSGGAARDVVREPRPRYGWWMVGPGQALGEPPSSGNTSDVWPLSPSTVVKLLRPGIPARWAEVEALTRPLPGRDAGRLLVSSPTPDVICALVSEPLT